MATLGNTTTPGTNWFEQGVNTPPNQVAQAFTTPSGGGIIITGIHAYFALVSGGSATAYCCVWDNSGNLIAHVSVSVPNGTATVGGQQWNTATLGTPVYVAGSTSIYIGFSVAEANGFFTTDESSGSSVWNTQSSVPGSLSGNTTSTMNGIGAYVDYTPAGGYVWNGSSWVACDIQIWNGSAWVDPTGDQVWNGSSWVNGS